MKFENTEVWGFEHALRGMPAKGYRKTNRDIVSNKSWRNLV